MFAPSFHRITHQAKYRSVWLSWGLLVVLAGLILLPSSMSRADTKPRLPGFTTLTGMTIVGYQGWFSCPADGTDLGWRHWSERGLPSIDSLAVDLWPDTSGFAADELCPTGLKRRDGRPAYLFSSANSKTVTRHFGWMKQYGISGAALQRFASELDDGRLVRQRDLVLNNVRGAAEKTGRGFFLMYDLSGLNGSEAMAVLSRDWAHLSGDMRITQSPSYIRHRGRPVIGIWGLGFRDRDIDPAQAAAIIAWFKAAGLTVLGGVPSGWRMLDGDARPEPEWAGVYRSLDVISPWSVGRFHNGASARNFLAARIVPDMREARAAGMDYLPVLFPGFSWHNLQGGMAAIDQISRDCGRFYQQQVRDAVGAGATMLYTAMFDEVNEGTAIFKVASRRQRPVGSNLVSFDNDRCSARTDTYLRLAGQATRALRDGR